MRFPKVSNPVKKRPNGSIEIVGLTPGECAKGFGLLCMLWLVLAAFAAVLLVIALQIRSSGEVLSRPGDPVK